MGQKSRTKRKPTTATRVEKPIEDSEDYCFVCKDGGFLILCDHVDCTKAYHENCINKQSAADSEQQWICGSHTCCKCRKSSSIRCLCCPNAVCESCIINNEEFSRIKGVLGICDECLKLALMVEEGRDVDSEGEEADFNDRESSEGLFKEYWEIVRDKESLTLKDLQAANAQMENCKTRRLASKRSHSDEFVVDEFRGEASDADCDIEVIQKSKSKADRKRVRPKRKKKKEEKVSNVREFVGWGSKPLIEFLASIGKDTSQKLTQTEVADIMITYAHEKNLFESGNKKKILSDDALHSILGRKSVTIYRIRDSLESHFLENLAESDDDEDENSSEDEELKSLLSSKKLKKHSSVKTCEKKERSSKDLQTEDAAFKKIQEDDASPVVYSRYASIVPENIKLVYLKRSLVEELLKNSEAFDLKVVGSIVKVKSVATVHKRRYELLQVTDVIKPANGNKADIVLKLSSMSDDVLISMLSDDDFSEEECEELRKKVEKGILERPTVVDLQQKVKTLHEHITKHAIARELIVLQHRIDLANEKGWRDLFYQYGQKRKLLQTPEEQARRLQNVPQVAADVIKDSKSGSMESLQNNSS